MTKDELLDAAERHSGASKENWLLAATTSIANLVLVENTPEFQRTILEKLFISMPDEYAALAAVGMLQVMERALQGKNA